MQISEFYCLKFLLHVLRARLAEELELLNALNTATTLRENINNE